MFSLLITIFSLILVGGLVTATMFYGGDAWTRNQAESEAARFMNESQQVSAAVKMYRTDHAGQMPALIEDLADGHYLRELPIAADGWNFSENSVGRTMSNDDSCRQVNRRVGNGDVLPTCGTEEVDPSWTIYCCTAETAGE